jgi:hypothetical protein
MIATKEDKISTSRWCYETPFSLKPGDAKSSSALSPDAASQLDILGHDSHTLGMNGTQISILEQSNQVSLGGLLKSKHRRALEAQIGLEVLRNLPHQPLERKLADEQLGGLLVLANLTKRHGSRPVAVGLLHSARGRGGLASRLSGQLLARCLASRRLASGLLRTRHHWFRIVTHRKLNGRSSEIGELESEETCNAVKMVKDVKLGVYLYVVEELTGAGVCPF